MAALLNSILDDTKKLLGISPDDPSFDTDVMIHINSTFSILHQLGVGPADGFEITSKNQLWADFLGTNKLVNSAKTLVYLQTRLWFDPPTNGGDLAAKKEQLLELQWRINVAVDKGIVNVFPIVPGWEQQIEDFLDQYLEDHPFADGFVHKQMVPAANWYIEHPLGRIPTVQVWINGELHLVEAEATENAVNIQFPSPAVGVAVLS